MGYLFTDTIVMIVIGILLIIGSIILAVYFRKHPLIYVKPEIAYLGNNQTEIEQNGYPTDIHNGERTESITKSPVTENLEYTDTAVDKEEKKIQKEKAPVTEILKKDPDLTEVMPKESKVSSTVAFIKETEIVKSTAKTEYLGDNSGATEHLK